MLLFWQVEIDDQDNQGFTRVRCFWTGPISFFFRINDVVSLNGDVFLLLFSFFVTDDFHKLFRNSGFIVSTILLRLSFSATGLVSMALVITSVIFGLLVLITFNQFQKAKREEGE